MTRLYLIGTTCVFFSATAGALATSFLFGWSMGWINVLVGAAITAVYLPLLYLTRSLTLGARK